MTDRTTPPEDAVLRVRPARDQVYPGRRKLSEAERNRYHGYVHTEGGSLCAPDCFTATEYTAHRRAGRVVLRAVESARQFADRMEREALSEVDAMLHAGEETHV